MPHALLPRHIIKVSGHDAVEFLQGQITKNTNNLREDTLTYALQLTPQGKYLYDMFILPQGDGSIWLDVANEQTDTILKRYGMFKLRMDVAFELMENQHAVALWPAPDQGEHEDTANSCYVDPRHMKLGLRHYTEDIQMDKTDAIADYHTNRIRLGVPDGQLDMRSGEDFPLFFRMDELGAIDFDKGCYVGQEVTARSKHRGNLRKSTSPLTCISGAGHAGDALHVEGKKCGQLLSTAGDVALAMLEKEIAENLQDDQEIISENGHWTLIHARDN